MLAIRFSLFDNIILGIGKCKVWKYVTKIAAVYRCEWIDK